MREGMREGMEKGKAEATEEILMLIKNGLSTEEIVKTLNKQKI
jgi:hypothetical protein